MTKAKVKAIPDGMHALTPYLTCAGGNKKNTSAPDNAPNDA